MSFSEERLLDRIKRNEKIIYLQVWKWTLNANKAHALQLGAFVGFVCAIFSFYVSVQFTAIFLMFLLLSSFGIKVEQAETILENIRIGEKSSIAILTIEHKPWYFWTTLIPTFVSVIGILYKIKVII